MRVKIKRKKISIFVLLLFVVVLLCIGVKVVFDKSLSRDLDKIEDYSSYYSEYVFANKDSKIYELVDGEYVEKGIVYENTRLMLDPLEDSSVEYFKIKDLDNIYYIKYSDISVSNFYYESNLRYKNYIVFNQNVVTGDVTTFYSDNNKLYTINKSFNLPIIIKDENKYYVEYNGMLLYVSSDSVKEVVDSNNTDKSNTSGVPVLNYHFVYRTGEERCNQEICHTEEQFRTHLSYIKDNNYFTPTMKELEMYLDKKIQLPSSVVITIDDGRNVNLATEILKEYQLNATAFIVTGRFNLEKDFVRSEYVEFQSHSHNLHNSGSCPSGHGQGGGLTCFSDEEVLNDLRTSRDLLDGAFAFCYPFYEYSSHSIELLKEAGYTMAFAGEYEGGYTKAVIGINKFKIPRWVIVNYTTMKDFESYVSGRA